MITEELMPRIRRVRLGTLPHTGNYRDRQAELVIDTFGFCKATLANYRKGTYDKRKQRLYALLKALPPSLLRELQNELPS
jgi:hypothetical protein